MRFGEGDRNFLGVRPLHRRPSSLDGQRFSDAWLIVYFGISIVSFWSSTIA